MTLAHQSAREAAYTILELRRGEHDSTWLRQRYDDKNRGTIRQHIKFAQYWYAANSCFTELKEHCAKIAPKPVSISRSAGSLELDWPGRLRHRIGTHRRALAHSIQHGTKK